MYSLIAQRDNLPNVKVAKAPLRIAEAIRTDNLATKTISEDSRAIAKDTKVVVVDSLGTNNVMRSIAVVTMVFLPAIFIVILFSTTFFNFQAQDGPVVSH